MFDNHSKNWLHFLQQPQARFATSLVSSIFFNYCNFLADDSSTKLGLPKVVMSQSFVKFRSNFDPMFCCIRKHIRNMSIINLATYIMSHGIKIRSKINERLTQFLHFLQQSIIGRIKASVIRQKCLMDLLPKCDRSISS